MAVSERAQVPTSAQRRAAVYDRSRANLTILSFVLAIGALLFSGMALTTSAPDPVTGDLSVITVAFAVVAGFAVPFSAAAGAAAFVLSSMRDAAREED